MTWSSWKGRISNGWGSRQYSQVSPARFQTSCRRASSMRSGAWVKNQARLGLHQIKEVSHSQVLLHLLALRLAQGSLAVHVRQFVHTAERRQIETQIKDG